jgi:predicted nucleotidyltransferase
MASETEIPEPLLRTLQDLLTWLRDSQVQGIVIGGIAASLLGRPRMTRDVDAVVLIDDNRWEEFLNRGSLFGFAPRRSDVLVFARQSRVLLVHHVPSKIDVDISFGVLPFEKEAINRAGSIPIGDLNIPLPTPEDLIIMKAVAHRPQDLGDIESVLDAHPKLDIRRVRRRVREFSKVLEMPEILNDLETILARRRKRK